MNRFFKISPIIFSLVTLLLLAMPANAQRRTCGADEVLQRQLEENPQMRQIREEIERQTQEFISHQGASDRGGMIITIPVVVHVVYFNSTQNITDAQIMSQIDVLNADFRRTNADAGSVPAPFQGVATDCEINFCMAKQDPNGFPTTGIERRETTVNGFSKLNNDVKFFSSGGLDIWDRNRYLNIWVCNTDVLGIAQFPGGPASTDGIVCDYAYFGNINATAPYDKGRTATHEIGHWLNCFHIWRDDGCNNSDLVADTPNQDDENFGCPSFPTVSCNNGPDGDMFMNYMDYTDDACMFMFTAGQKSRMQAVLNGSRASLMNSLGCKDPCSPPYTVTHINANTLFGTDMNMLGDIHVHSNAELVIEAEIRMPQGTRILVERNARLVIGTGGKVTRLCNNWEGIQVLGNNQKVQPEYNAPLTDPNQAGIVWVNNGTVEWARTGVTAGGGYGPEFWGGVIRTENNAVFQNNRKDIEFMSYKFSANKSRFSNTSFVEIGDAFANTEGVTIWETNGIEFQNSTFKHKDQEGIRTYDAGVSVLNNNAFENNGIGVVSSATYPMSGKIQIGSGTTAENKFRNNYIHIGASETASSLGDFSLDVINNNFSGGLYGVIVEGASNFRIAGNLLTNVSTVGAAVSNTGFNSLFNQNLIGCNTFKNGATSGIYAWGDNKQMQFLGNDFQMSSGTDFFLTETSGPQIKGTIRATQGENNKSAGNCFTDPGPRPDIVAPFNITNSFKYYYQGGVPPAGCDVQPLTPGNYSKQVVNVLQSSIDCNQFGGLPYGLPYPTPGDLNTRRTTLQQLTPYIASDANALNQYYITLQEKDAILRYLVKQSLAAGQYATAEGFLAGEQSKAGDWAIYGLRMDRKDYANAALWLNQMPIQNDEDTKFRDVQLINIQRLQNPGTFQLSVAQELLLNTIAEGASPVRGYARGILGLLKDRRFYPDPINVGGAYAMPIVADASAQSANNTTLFRVFPVPASTAVNISWPALPDASDARLLVYDIFGRQQISEPILPLENQRALETEHLPNGVYFVLLEDKGRPVHQAKFSIQH